MSSVRGVTDPRGAALQHLKTLAAGDLELAEKLRQSAQIVAEAVAADFCTVLSTQSFVGNVQSRPPGAGADGVIGGVSLVFPPGEPLGALAVRPRSGQDLSPSDRAFLEEAGGIVGRAIRRHRSASAAIQSSECFRAAFQDSPAGKAIVDADLRFLHVNRALCDLAGHSETAFRALTLDAVTHAPGRAELIRLTGEVFQGRLERFQTEGTLIASTGAELPVSVTITLIRGGEPAAPHAVVRIEDQTAQRRRERDLRLARFTLDHSRESIYWNGPDGRIFDVSEAMSILLGYTRGQLLSMQVFGVDPTLSAEQWPEAWRELAERGHLARESRFRRADGSEVAVEIDVNYFESGGAEYACTIARDITERKQVAAELESREARYRSLFENSAAMVSTLDLTGRFTAVNKALEAFSGYGRDELVGRDIAVLLAPDQREVARRMLHRKLREGGTTAYDLELLCKDGRLRPIRMTSNLIEENGLATGTHGVAIDISEQRRADEAARSSSERFRTLIENSMDLIAVLDGNGTVNYVSPSVERILGYAPHELVGREPRALIHPDDLVLFEAGMDALRRGPGAHVKEEIRVLAKDTSWRLMEVTVRNLLDHPAVRGIVVNSRDITARREAEAALRESEERFRAAFSHAVIGFAMATPDGRVVSVNPAFCAITGFAADHLRNMEFRRLIHPDDLEENIQLVDRMFAGDIDHFVIENRYLRPDGNPVWVRKSVSMVRGEEGSPRWIITLVEDVTTRIQRERDLRESEQRLRIALESARGGVWDNDLMAGGAWWSPEMFELWGVEPGKPPRLEEALQVIHADDQGRFEKAISHSTRSGGNFDCEFRILHHSRGERWMSASGRPVFDGAGRAVRLLGITVDVTERKQADEDLRRSEQRLRLAATSASDLIYESDLQTGDVMWFGEIDERLGYERGELPRSLVAWRQSIHPDDRERVSGAIERSLKDGDQALVIEYRIRTKGGEYRHWLERGRHVRDASGRPYRSIGACEDVTAKKQAEEELRRSQTELRALASQLFSREEEEHRTVARELHDDFGQRLTALGFDLASLDSALSPDPAHPVRKRLRLAQAQVAALSDDLRRLAHLLHPSAIELLGLPVALRELCRDMAAHAEFAVRFSARNLPEPIPRDATICLYRVSQECLRNVARHAKASHVAVMLTGLERTIRLSIQDDGVGFDPALKVARSGLGLISMRERVRLAGGTLTLKSCPGGGTRVTVELPRPAGEEWEGPPGGR